MLPIRIAVAAHCLPQPWRRAFVRAREMTADGLQFDARNELKPSELTETGRRQLLGQLRDLHLSVASLKFPTRGTYYEQERLDARIDATKKAMDLCAGLQTAVLTARAGKIPEQDSAEYELLRNVLNDICRYGNRIGVTFCVSTARDSVESLRSLLDTVKEGPVGVNLDTAACVLTGRDPSRMLRDLHPFVTHITIRDAVRDVDGDGVEVPLGRGEVDWDEFLAVVDETNYAGWLTIDRTTGDDPETDAARAVQFLKNVMPP